MKRSRVLFLGAGGCVLLAAIARFALFGYRFSALCLLCLAAVLAFYGLMARWQTKTAKRLSVVMTCLLGAGLILFTVAEIPIWRDGHSDVDTDAPYIIVFGAAIHGTTPSLAMTERTEAAFAWLEAHPDGIAVLSGGQGRGEEMTEAEAMYNWLEARGISPDRMLTETLSENSYENLLFSLRVIADHSGDPNGRVALCSTEYHMCRLSYMARQLGVMPVRVAAHSTHPTLRLNYAMREAAALWKCWLFGIE